MAAGVGDLQRLTRVGFDNESWKYDGECRRQRGRKYSPREPEEFQLFKTVWYCHKISR